MAQSHLNLLASQLTALQAYNNGAQFAIIDGHSLDVPSVVAVSRKNHVPRLEDSDAIKIRVAAAVDVVQNLALEAQSQYGVTTGFGGSATTRTKRTALLQKALLACIQCGILPDFRSKGVKDLTPEDYSLMLPQDWVRGTMFVRLNSIIRAQSGTRWNIIESLYTLIEENVAPCAPLRQSISASGDLGPLAYISGVLTGNPDVFAWYGEGEGRKIYDSATLLRKLNLAPIDLIAKEGLALVNGTAASAAVAALAIHDCHILALAAQVLAAYGNITKAHIFLTESIPSLAVEAIKGSQEPFQPFLHDLSRPHKGQIEVAANIRHILQSSKLARIQHEESDPMESRNGTLNKFHDGHQAHDFFAWVSSSLLCYSYPWPKIFAVRHCHYPDLECTISLPGSPSHSYATHIPGRRFSQYVIVIILTSSARFHCLGLLLTPMLLISLAEDFRMHDFIAWVSSSLLCYSYPWPKIFEVRCCHHSDLEHTTSSSGSPLHPYVTHIPGRRFLQYVMVIILISSARSLRLGLLSIPMLLISLAEDF
ncbi:L-Aspartase-like protein [Lentinula edodes]|nr:L-Aspartase-like protein [Lentinula edodes]